MTITRDHEANIPPRRLGMPGKPPATPAKPVATPPQRGRSTTITPLMVALLLITPLVGLGFVAAILAGFLLGRMYPSPRATNHAGVIFPASGDQKVPLWSPEPISIVPAALPAIEPANEEVPRLAATENNVVTSGVVPPHDATARDEAPPGGWLVGLHLVKGQAWGGAIEAVVPIYQIGDRYEYGKRIGGPAEVESKRFLARPGYALGKIHCRAGLDLNALQLEFHRIQGKRLDPADNYITEWYGTPGGGVLPSCGGDGHPLVGIIGSGGPRLTRLLVLQSMELPTVEAPLPLVAGKSIPTTPQRPGRGQTFKDEAPKGGWLVGLRIFQGESWGGTPQAVQPIYQVGDSYVMGRRYGREGGEVRQILAKPGYAVAALNLNVGLVVNTVEIAFRRVNEKGLQVGDSYHSEVVGAPGGAPVVIHADGRPVVGLTGSYDHDINSLGLLVIENVQ